MNKYLYTYDPSLFNVVMKRLYPASSKQMESVPLIFLKLIFKTTGRTTAMKRSGVLQEEGGEEIQIINSYKTISIMN